MAITPQQDVSLKAAATTSYTQLQLQPTTFQDTLEMAPDGMLHDSETCHAWQPTSSPQQHGSHHKAAAESAGSWLSEPETVTLPECTMAEATSNRGSWSNTVS